MTDIYRVSLSAAAALIISASCYTLHTHDDVNLRHALDGQTRVVEVRGQWQRGQTLQRQLLVRLNL